MNKQMYAKDAYFLLTNLIMDEKVWKSYQPGFEWNANVEKEFKMFVTWPQGYNEKFLSKLFYGARTDHIDKAKATRYLTFILYDFHLFLAENMYNRLINDSKFKSATIYRPVFENEIDIFDKIINKLTHLGITLDSKVEGDVKSTYMTFFPASENTKYRDYFIREESALEKVFGKEDGLYWKFFPENTKYTNYFTKHLANLESVLTKMFATEITIPKNVFSNHSNEKPIDVNDKVVYGIDSMGTYYAIEALTQLPDKEAKKFRFASIGGQNRLWNFTNREPSSLYNKLIKKNIEFKCFVPEEVDMIWGDDHFVRLEAKDFQPLPIRDYRSCYYDRIFLHCLLNGFTF